MKTIMKTKDYGLASLMLSKNKKMINHVRDEYGRYWFEFEDDEQLETDFYTNDAVVHVQDYLNAQRRIFQQSQLLYLLTIMRSIYNRLFIQ